MPNATDLRGVAEVLTFMDIFFLVDFVDIHFITNSSNNIVNHQCLTFQTYQPMLNLDGES